jgi:hypothetical protein
MPHDRDSPAKAYAQSASKDWPVGDGMVVGINVSAPIWPLLFQPQHLEGEIGKAGLHRIMEALGGVPRVPDVTPNPL